MQKEGEEGQRNLVQGFSSVCEARTGLFIRRLFFFSFLFRLGLLCPSLLYHVWRRQFRGQVVDGGRGAC